MEQSDEPVDEEEWCAAQRVRLVEYLTRELPVHGEVGDWPAWHVCPYVAAWAIESVARPGSVGWWAITGDLPTDYTTCGPERHPREGVRDIAQRWKNAATIMAEGKVPPDWKVGADEDQASLAPLLAGRAKILLDWVADDTMWED